ncbi:hypothetical protein [Natronorubrum daqingense]|uniref:Uncharacterized protein n=1 Tax=Natronorubrum daqingense TaxID=588898 RepID=A0A1N7EPT2_9EURY|nr:hypothetical protein [Natronorubrum daqingense]APX97811.1 hypothetical protein BB347_14945 [Natronorubrum daqingense]SIR90064.1 hypothetical protein SAMN05421809_2765 [Natronorubrum daqingense]
MNDCRVVDSGARSSEADVELRTRNSDEKQRRETATGHVGERDERIREEGEIFGERDEKMCG